MKACLFALLTASYFGRLFFKLMPLIDGGAVHHLYKNKKQMYLSGEDGHCTTRLTLSVADGVGGSKFLSYYIANILALQSSIAFLEVLKIKQQPLSPSSKSLKAFFWQEKMLNRIKDELQEYRKFSQETYSNLLTEQKKLILEKEKSVSLDNWPSVLGSSATLASCAIDDTDSADRKLLIVQKGDSRIAVLRPTLNSSKSGYYYSLVYLSEEMQKRFNHPYQFGVLTEDEDSLNNEFDEFPIKPRDIVLVGSDGFFDNMHASILTHAVNFLAKKFSLSKIDTLDADDVKSIKDLAESYAKIFDQPIEVKDKSPKNPIKEEKEETQIPKIEEEVPKKKKSGGFFSGLLCGSKKKKAPKKTDVNPINKHEEKISVGKTEIPIPAADKPVIIKSIFQCSPPNIVQALTNAVNHFSEIFYSDCVLQGLEGEFLFSEGDLISFEKLYHSRFFAEHLKNVALHLSSREGYPSPFFLAKLSKNAPMFSLAEKLILPYKAGKPDDITIMSGLIWEFDGLYDSKIEEHTKELSKKKEHFYQQLKEDIQNFVKEYNSEAYAAMYHRPLESKPLKAFENLKYRIL